MKTKAFRILMVVLVVLAFSARLVLATDYPAAPSTSLSYEISVHGPDDFESVDLSYYLYINLTLMGRPPVPTLGVISFNATYPDKPIRASIDISTTASTDWVSHYFGRWNDTGSWVNFPAVAVGESSVTGYFDSIVTAETGSIVCAMFYANNSYGDWGVSSVYSFEVSESAPEPPDYPHDPPAVGEYVYLDFYFYPTIHTINNVTAYEALVDPPSSAAYVGISTASSANISWGIRTYLQFGSSSLELTDGSPEAVLTQTTVNGSGGEVLEGTFGISETSMTFGKTALRIDLYSRWDEGTWSIRSVYITDYIFYPKIGTCEPTFSAYCNRTESGGVTYATFRWGTPTYLSGLFDVAFKQGTPTDWQRYELGEGNLIGFLLAPYLAIIGNLFYALILFGFGGSIYIRYRNVSMIALFLVAFGGAGGVINLIIGDAYIGFVWLVLSFGIGLVLWRVFR